MEDPVLTNDLESYVNSFVKQNTISGNSNAEILRIADAMKSRNYSLHDMIELLGPFLNSHEEKDRNRATLLVALLIDVPDVIVKSPAVIHLFVVFFCRRLHDFPSIAPCLQALTSIIKSCQDVFDTKYCDISDIFSHLTKQIHIPSYAQNIRQRAIELLFYLFQQSSYREALELSMTNYHIFEGILNVFDNEKDPRCLLVSLQLLSYTLSHYDTYLIELKMNTIHEGEDIEIIDRIFEQTSCYFPIAFSPPPDDPIGISPLTLSQLLEDCLCSHKALISYSIPFFFDHIHHETSQTRIAALHAIYRIIYELGYMSLLSTTKSTTDTDTDHHDHDYMEDDEEEDAHHDHHNHIENDYTNYLHQMSDIIYDIITQEANEQILHEIYQIVQILTKSIVHEYSKIILIEKNETIHLEEQLIILQETETWKYYFHELFSKITIELQGNLESIKVQQS
jgi:hypothetical protein